mgnify:CR=1 FL=1
MPGSFNGSTSRITVSTYPALQWTNQFVPWTYHIRVRPNLLATLQVYLDQADATLNRLIVRLRQNANDKIEALIVQQSVVALASVESTNAVTSGDEVDVTIVNDGTNLHLYIDGAEDANSPAAISTGAVLVANGTLHIGQLFNATSRLNADTGEVAVWDVALTVEEIESMDKGTNPSQIRSDRIVLYVPVENSGATEANLSPISDANNGVATDILAAAEPFRIDGYFPYEQYHVHEPLVTPWYDNAWNRRKKITIDESMVAGTVDKSNFVLAIPVTDIDLIAARADGFDFVVADNDGTTKLSHERKRWNNVTGELMLWVKVPNLKALTNTGLWLYYDNPSATDQQDVTNTWPVTYKMVQHLDDDFLDSTSNDNDGTNTGSTNAAGLLADGQEFDNSSEKIEIPDDPSLKFATPNRITVAAAFNVTTFNSVDKVITKAKTSSPFGPFEIRLSHDSGNNEMDATLATGGTEHLMVGTTTPVTGTFYVAHLKYDGSIIKFFIDENLEDSLANSDTIDDSTSPITIGNHHSFGGGDFKGIVDECQILDSALDDDTIRTRVRNWKNPATYITLGMEESLGQVIKVVSDSLSMSEAPLIIKIVKILQSLGVTDSSEIAKVVRLLESMSLSDISTVPNKIVKFLSNIAVSHSIVPSKTVRIAESFIVSSVVARIAEAIKLVTDSLSMSHTVSFPGKLIKLVQSVMLSEAVSRIAPGVTKLVTDSLAISDIPKISKTLKLAESFSISVLAKLTKTVKIPESFGLSDAVSVSIQVNARKISGSLKSFLGISGGLKS